MTIIHGDYPAGKAAEARKREVSKQESTPRREAGGMEPVAAKQPAETLESAGAKIRAHLVELQRDISRQQRLLGGLSGLRDMLRMLQPGVSLPDTRLNSTIDAVVYQGEKLLAPMREELKNIAGSSDLEALDKHILLAKNEIARLSAVLGKYEIADQNARSLPARESLEAIARDLREEGGLPQRLSREHVLKLLS